MKAVAEQITSVSRKTDSIWTSPCFTGWLTLAEAAALGGGAHAGLVGKEAPLHALHHGRAGEAGEDGLEIERLGEDPSEHLGNQPPRS